MPERGFSGGKGSRIAWELVPLSLLRGKKALYARREVRYTRIFHIIFRRLPGKTIVEAAAKAARPWLLGQGAKSLFGLVKPFPVPQEGFWDGSSLWVWLLPNSPESKEDTFR